MITENEKRELEEDLLEKISSGKFFSLKTFFRIITLEGLLK